MRTMIAIVQLKKKIAGRESEGSCREEQLIGGKRYSLSNSDSDRCK
jgi:hypothetical protein